MNLGLAVLHDTVFSFLINPEGRGTDQLALFTLISWNLAPVFQIAAIIFFMIFAKMYRISGGAQAGYIPAPEGLQENAY